MLCNLYRVQKLFTKHLDRTLLLYTIEELSELIHSLCKYEKLLREVEEEATTGQKNRKFTKHHLAYRIIEDMADVEICLKQLEYFLVNQGVVSNLENLNKLLQCYEEEKIQNFALEIYGARKAHKLVGLYKKEKLRNEG